MPVASVALCNVREMTAEDSGCCNLGFNIREVLEQNWRLQFQLSTSEVEISALKCKLKFVEDTSSFLCEKMRLEDVLSSLLNKVRAHEFSESFRVQQILNFLFRLAKTKIEAGLSLVKRKSDTVGVDF